jgi:hypothetical protein
LRAHLRAPLAGDAGALREWVAGLWPFDRSLPLEALAALLEGALDEWEGAEGDWRAQDAVAAARAAARCPCSRHRAETRAAADEAEAAAEEAALDPAAAMIVASAGRLARLGAEHDPLGSPKSLFQGAGVILRTLIAAGTSPQAAQATMAHRLTVNLD